MQPTGALLDSMQTSLAQDTSALAAATTMNVHLIVAPFSPSENTSFGSLTEATFTGGAAKAVTAGNQQQYTDPTTHKRVVQLLEPAGGWTWKCTVAPTPGQTVYGICLTDHANAVTWGSALLETPVPIANVNDAVVVGNITFEFDPPVLS
jgi:hypothetical protein